MRRTKCRRHRAHLCRMNLRIAIRTQPASTTTLYNCSCTASSMNIYTGSQLYDGDWAFFCHSHRELHRDHLALAGNKRRASGFPHISCERSSAQSNLPILVVSSQTQGHGARQQLRRLSQSQWYVANGTFQYGVPITLLKL